VAYEKRIDLRVYRDVEFWDVGASGNERLDDPGVGLRISAVRC